MQRFLMCWTGVFICVMTVGCAICQSPYDTCYPTYGGTGGCEAQRQGRAGSILDSPVGGYNHSNAWSVEEELEPIPQTADDEDSGVFPKIVHPDVAMPAGK